MALSVNNGIQVFPNKGLEWTQVSPNTSLKWSEATQETQIGSFNNLSSDVAARVFHQYLNQNAKEVPIGVCRMWEGLRNDFSHCVQRTKLLVEFFPEVVTSEVLKMRENARETFFKNNFINPLSEVSDSDSSSNNCRLLECLITDEEASEILNKLKGRPLSEIQETKEKINKINKDWLEKAWLISFKNLIDIIRRYEDGEEFLKALNKTHPFRDAGTVIEIKFWVLSQKIKKMALRGIRDIRGNEFLTSLDYNDTKISKIKKMQQWLSDTNLVYLFKYFLIYADLDAQMKLHLPENTNFIQGVSDDNLHNVAESLRTWLKDKDNQEFLNSISILSISRTVFFDHGLTELPPEIGQLKNLKKLLLDENELITLPPEIGRLKKLQRLSVCENRLTALPPEIGQLKNLKLLSLTKNKLITLPPEMDQLKKLQRLRVPNNPLTTIPPEICLLPDLECFEYSEETLKTFPPELEKFRGVTRREEINHRSWDIKRIALIAIGCAIPLGYFLASRYNRKTEDAV
ncbi:MAG: leucine-rich repeat domain-containing protein [Parachlamydiales bacterium]